MTDSKGFDLDAYVGSFCERLGRAATIEDTRRVFDGYPMDPTPVAGTVVLEIENPSGSWIGCRSHNPAHRGVYLHGGGYLAGSIQMYAGLVSRLAVATRTWIFVPNFPLAPEFRFPSAHDAARDAGHHVLTEGPFAVGKPQSVIFIGDSCGAALAIATALRMRKECEAGALSAIVGLSPTLDMTAAGESYARCVQHDKIVSRELTRHCAATYAPDTDAFDSRLSPLYGEFTGLPPVLLQVSKDESVFDDSVRAAAIAKQQGCQLEVQIWAGMPHVWHLLAPQLRDAEQAISRVGEFIITVTGSER